MGRKKKDELRDSGIAIEITAGKEEFVGSKITITDDSKCSAEVGESESDKGLLESKLMKETTEEKLKRARRKTNKKQENLDSTKKSEDSLKQRNPVSDKSKGATEKSEELTKEKPKRSYKKRVKLEDASGDSVDYAEDTEKIEMELALKAKRRRIKKSDAAKSTEESDLDKKKTVTSKVSKAKVADIKKSDLSVKPKEKEEVKLAANEEFAGLDVVISFDTTGSMYPVLAQVRQNVESTIRKMFEDFTDLRVGIIVHGDYCDKNNPYTLKLMDLTKDKQSICEFVRTAEKTYGGDAPECYELVLNVARTKVSWKEDRKKLLILIGDANPHGVDYSDNKDHLDWEDESDKLGKMQIPIYAVHALPRWRSESKRFYESLAKRTAGVYLTLDNFNEVVELIKASMYSTTYTEEQINEYVSIIRKEGKLSSPFANNLERLFGVTVEVGHKRTGREDKSKTVEGLSPVPDGRFQVMNVNFNASIKEFLEYNGITFKAGRTFYELLKTETVHQYKEIILQDKETKEMFYGSDVREKLGLLPQCLRSEKYANEKLKPSSDSEYTIFVQSTSYNRKLPENSRVLYEVPDFE